MHIFYMKYQIHTGSETFWNMCVELNEKGKKWSVVFSAISVLISCDNLKIVYS